MLNRDAILSLLTLAETDGLAAATAALDASIADQADEDHEGRIDALRAFDEDPTGQDREGAYIAGCGPDDTIDFRGRPLRPRVNDAGEPRWM